MRRQPYTDAGLCRLTCSIFGCSARAAHQWRVRACAQGGPEVWRPVCGAHDLFLNELVLDFFDVPGRHEMLADYARHA